QVAPALKPIDDPAGEDPVDRRRVLLQLLNLRLGAAKRVLAAVGELSLELADFGGGEDLEALPALCAPSPIPPFDDRVERLAAQVAGQDQDRDLVFLNRPQAFPQDEIRAMNVRHEEDPHD